MQTYKLGRLELFFLQDGTFMHDGGAMFGVVPKTIWEKLAPPDERNRILLSMNPLLVRVEDRLILIDPGIGDKYDAKIRQIYSIENRPNIDETLGRAGIRREEIHLIVPTHMHFDHIGACTRKDKSGKVVPSFPRAKHLVQKGEWEDALHPNERTRASYIPDDFLPLEMAGLIEFIDGDAEIVPGVSVRVTGGHTLYHQIVILDSEGEKAAFLGGLLPMATHAPLPYIMAFDLYPLQTLEQRKKLYRQAIDEKWLLILEHDPRLRAGYLEEREGKHSIRPVVVEE